VDGVDINLKAEARSRNAGLTRPALLANWTSNSLATARHLCRRNQGLGSATYSSKSRTQARVGEGLPRIVHSVTSDTSTVEEVGLSFDQFERLGRDYLLFLLAELVSTLPISRIHRLLSTRNKSLAYRQE